MAKCGNRCSALGCGGSCDLEKGHLGPCYCRLVPEPLAALVRVVALLLLSGDGEEYDDVPDDGDTLGDLYGAPAPKGPYDVN